MHDAFLNDVFFYGFFRFFIDRVHVHTNNSNADETLAPSITLRILIALCCPRHEFFISFHFISLIYLFFLNSKRLNSKPLDTMQRLGARLPDVKIRRFVATPTTTTNKTTRSQLKVAFSRVARRVGRREDTQPFV